jgi:hypothetical protein
MNNECHGPTVGQAIQYLATTVFVSYNQSLCTLATVMMELCGILPVHELHDRE